MTAASAQPAFRSHAHRRVVMAHIGATLGPTALAFAALAPLAGLILIWGSTFVALVCQSITTAGATTSAALGIMWDVLVAGYAASVVAAAITGVWVALLSPFTPENPRYYIGAAILGMMNGYLFVSVAPDTPGLFGGQLFLAIVGAVSSFVCAWLLRDSVLKRDEARRDRLAADRAERLAKERKAAKA